METLVERVPLADPPALQPALARILALLPGIVLCLLVALAALGAGRVEALLTGSEWLEPLVLAILIGTAVRTAWHPSDRWQPGIHFGAKPLLEVAIVLLGATVSGAAILAIGPMLIGSIALVVVAAIGISLAIGHLLGLPRRMAILIACGNSICGNSAIAAVAPVIDADSDDVASSIAFTAVLGVAVVVGLPFLGHALGMDALRYGALAGLTVYAVPQVLAASASFGQAAIQTGTLVKLVRVLMLGPVCFVLGLLAPRLREEGEDWEDRAPMRISLAHLVPWFIVGFLALVGLRSLDLVPHVLVEPAKQGASLLTIVAMAIRLADHLRQLR